MPNERVLVVDDEVNARQALKSLLTDEGFEVAEAADGEEALQKLQSFSPAAVLTDVRMPKLDGLSFLKQAREGGSDAAFVVMTAFGSIDRTVSAIE